MKAKLKVYLPGFTGIMVDVVIYYNTKLNKYIARKKVKPNFTPDHADTQQMHAFRRRIAVSEEYIDDCWEYIKLFMRKFCSHGSALSTWPNVYMKNLRALAKQYPQIDFKTLTRQDVLQQSLPYKSVKAA